MDDSQDPPELEKALLASPDHTRPEPLRSQLADHESVPLKRVVRPPAAQNVDASAVRAGVEAPDPAHARDAVSQLPSSLPAARVDYKGADLRKADLRKFDLAGANFAGADLTAANLSGSDLTGANFAGANLSSLPEAIFGEQPFFSDVGQANGPQPSEPCRCEFFRSQSIRSMS